MEIEINIINVEDGDAIIIIIKESNESNVILIDGGEVHFEKRVLKRLNKVLEENGNKKGPDLVVCTHIDDDHITGIANVIQFYGNNIGQLWVFKESRYLLEQDRNLSEALNSRSWANSVGAWGLYCNLAKENILNESYQIDEGVKQLNRLYNLLSTFGFDTSKIIEPFVGTQFKELPFIVLAPSHSFFNQCYDHQVSLLQNLKLATNSWKSNRSSVICILESQDQKYLFTGDAEPCSFKDIRDYEKVINNLFFLDVPHHGSSSGLNDHLINIMNPQKSIVSAIFDKVHPNKDIIGKLKHSGEVHTTNEVPKTWYLEYKSSTGKINRILDTLAK